ncbi:hypothetical protein ACFLRY_04870 [Bacteroidota bacterium]
MFIRYFKSSYLPQYILLAIITLILWAFNLIYPIEGFSEQFLQPAYDLSTSILKNIWVLVIIGILIFYIQAVFLNSMLIANDIVPKNSLIPAFVFLVIGSASFEYLTFTPLTFTVLFLIFALERLFKCYGNTKSFSEILSASLFVSIASLFFFPAIVFLLLIYIMLINFSLTNWRLWIIPIIGIVIPYLYLFAFYFVTDQLAENLDLYNVWWNSIGIVSQNLLSIKFLGHVLIIILSIISILYYMSHIQEKNIIIRKKMILVGFFTLISIIISIFNVGNFDFLYILIALPLSVFISFYLGNTKIKKVHEYFIWLIIICLILINYQIL